MIDYIYLCFDDNNNTVGIFFSFITMKEMCKDKMKVVGGRKVELRCLKDEGICTAGVSLHLWEHCAFFEWRWEEMEILYKH